jgi:hypothetical protein
MCDCAPCSKYTWNKKDYSKQQDTGNRNEGENDTSSSTCVNTSRLQTQQCKNSSLQTENYEWQLLDILKEKSNTVGEKI